jgi:hypothetical protein
VSLKSPATPAPGGDEEKLLEISGPMTVNDLAAKMGVRSQDIQRELMNFGVLAGNMRGDAPRRIAVNAPKFILAPFFWWG